MRRIFLLLVIPCTAICTALLGMTGDQQGTETHTTASAATEDSWGWD